MRFSESGDQAGFTLIEMIVVIVIMAFISGLVMIRNPWRSVEMDIEATVRTLISDLRVARSRAIAQDRNVAVVTNSNGFAVDDGSFSTLPAGETLSPSRVIFMPDGGSSGAEIVLAGRSRRIAISVNWLTGRSIARDMGVP